MIKVTYTPSFQRAYKKIFKNQPQRQEHFLKKVSLFIEDPYHPQLKTHKLKGDLKNLYSFSIEYDIRIIFLFFPILKSPSKTSAHMMKCTKRHTFTLLYPYLHPNLFFLCQPACKYYNNTGATPLFGRCRRKLSRLY